ncbi:UMP kinase [Candidatus Saccharibacteria bacterium]|nr:UMP kinase [Candidatus Saccharibacteria bacterium]
MDTRVISVGGSIIVPESRPDDTLIAKFVRMSASWLNVHDNRRLVLVVGGGATARNYQKAYIDAFSRRGMLVDAVAKNSTITQSAAADMIGVTATHLNAALLRYLFDGLAVEPVVTDPTAAPSDWRGRVLIAGGWKPGFSTDTDAVYLAEKYGAKIIMNLSNIKQVHDKDPSKYPDAKPLDRITWADFRKMVGDEWTPGLNAPFDPIASKKAAELGLTVICADGHNIENTRAILNGEPFIGTTIGG